LRRINGVITKKNKEPTNQIIPSEIEEQLRIRRLQTRKERKKNHIREE